MLPLHVPLVVVSSLPTSGVPETTGGPVFDGAVATPLVAAKPAAARIASPSAVTAAISSGLAIEACRNRGCPGTRSMVTSFSLLTNVRFNRSAHNAAGNVVNRSSSAAIVVEHHPRERGLARPVRLASGPAVAGSRRGWLLGCAEGPHPNVGRAVRLSRLLTLATTIVRRNGGSSGFWESQNEGTRPAQRDEPRGSSHSEATVTVVDLLTGEGRGPIWEMPPTT